MNTKVLMKSNQLKEKNFIISLIIFTLTFLITVFLFAILSLFGIWDTLNQIFVKRNIIYSISKKAFFFFQIFVDLPGFVVIVLFFYNFLNIYKCMILVLSYSLSQYISSILQLMFNDINPISSKLFSSCSNYLGNPNRKSIISVAMYLAMWQALVSSNELKNRKKTKVLLFAIIIEIIVIINFVNLFSHNYPFHQIFFGIVLGLFIYCFMFNVLGIEMNNPKQFFGFINTRWFCLMEINVVFLLILVLASRIHSLDDDALIERLQKSALKSCESFSITLNWTASNRLRQELIINASIIFINIGFYIALNLERRFFFENNAELYGKFNFNGYDIQSESFTSELIATKDNQWNNTVPYISISRLLLEAIVLGGFLFILMFLVANFTNGFYALLTEVVLMSNVIIIILVFFMKIGLKKMRLINMKIYQIPLFIVQNIDDEEVEIQIDS